jgi:predicted MPP superfamily phosphohydrolase
VATRSIAFGLRLAGRHVARELPSLRVATIVHHLSSLPEAAEGRRLLHLSDLHLESLPAWQSLAAALATLDWDALLFTGDFAEGPSAPGLVSAFGDAMPLRPGAPRLAVLGNHDRSSILPTLSDVGFDVLMNRARPLWDDTAGLWAVGVDDPATFRTHDVATALSGVPSEACVIFMAHSPDLAGDASNRGCALYLCGHTHGGQIVLPRFGPVGYRKRYPREQIAGKWLVGGMAGYTSVGLGARHGLVRVGCTPEITLHELRRSAGG